MSAWFLDSELSTCSLVTSQKATISYVVCKMKNFDIFNELPAILSIKHATYNAAIFICSSKNCHYAVSL